MKTLKFLALALSMTWVATAHAQQGNAQRNNNNGLLPLPEGISRLIAVDAQNSLPRRKRWRKWRAAPIFRHSRAPRLRGRHRALVRRRSDSHRALCLALFQSE